MEFPADLLQKIATLFPDNRAMRRFAEMGDFATMAQHLTTQRITFTAQDVRTAASGQIAPELQGKLDRAAAIDEACAECWALVEKQREQASGKAA